MNIFEIFKSYDFKNNKLLNTKTENPIDDEHIVPKKYVDISNTYNTTKAQRFTNSIKFPWITEFFNKPIKQILDDLFFPIINPIYINPEFSTVFLKIEELLNIVGEKKVLYYGNNITLIVDYFITQSDRISGIVPKLIIQNIDNSIIEFNGTETSDINGTIICNFKFDEKISKITLRKEFSESQIIKKTNYDNDYIPIEFTIDYNLDFNILKLITEKYLISYPIFYRKSNNINYIDIYDNISNYVNEFIKSNKLFLQAEEIEQKFILLIPETIYNNSINIHCNIDNEKQIISWNILKNNTKLLPIINYFPSNLLNLDLPIINYYFLIIDLGYYNTTKFCEFQFNLIK